MRCPQCGDKFAVKDSRPGTTDPSKYWAHVRDLLEWAQAKVGWWTVSDWIARRRVCIGCGFTQRTIEIFEDDLVELLKPPPEDDNA